MAVSLILLHTTAPVRWRIHRNDGPLAPFEVAGYPVINPSLLDDLGDQPGRGVDTCMPSADEATFSASSLGLVTTKSLSAADRDSLRSGVAAFIRWLRVLGGQYQLPSAPMVVAILDNLTVETLACPEFPTYVGETNGSVRSDLLATAVTLTQAADAAARATRKEPVSMPHHFFVDAVAALYEDDFRLSLLSAAIAIESLAAGYLEDEYERRLVGGPGPDIRITKTPQPGGQVTVKDPVYEALNARTDFGSLLHERPLYLTGRSLLVEQPSLFALMKRLYTTRNKIAHRGDVTTEDADRCFELGRKDTETALGAVRDVFTWFGATPPPLYDRTLIPTEMVSWGHRCIEI